MTFLPNQYEHRDECVDRTTCDRMLRARDEAIAALTAENARLRDELARCRRLLADAPALFRPLAEWQEGNPGLPDDRMPVFLYVREVRDLANWARSLGVIDDRACVCGEPMWAHTGSNGCGHPTPAGEG